MTPSINATISFSTRIELKFIWVGQLQFFALISSRMLFTVACNQVAWLFVIIVYRINPTVLVQKKVNCARKLESSVK